MTDPWYNWKAQEAQAREDAQYEAAEDEIKKAPPETEPFEETNRTTKGIYHEAI